MIWKSLWILLANTYLKRQMIDTITYADQTYPAFQAAGFAAKFAFPFAKEVCKGNCGYDIGYCKEEWKFPNAIGVDLAANNEYHAMNLPEMKVDYIMSSHMLEHYVGRFQDVIEYWLTKIKKGGVIFLYLPNCEYQKYWAWGNKKHIHYLSPSIMREYCQTLDIAKYFVTDGYDLNGSFYCVIEK